MNCYHHFTIEERENRFLFHEKGCAIREFARRLKQSLSTISRELLCKKGTGQAPLKEHIRSGGRAVSEPIV